MFENTSRLGKRKRDAVVARRKPAQNAQSAEVVSDQPDGIQDVLRQYFEANFEPLPQIALTSPAIVEDEIQSGGVSDKDSEWEGLSEGEEEGEAPSVQAVQVVEHRTDTDEADASARSEYKHFMSSKPPRDIGRTAAKPSAPKSTTEEDPAEVTNLKHDLDLQRLLKESHLLEEAKSSSKPGTQRHKATDLRLRMLGSKTSLFNQEKMPLSHRKGISAKAAMREALRRKDAQENGVVLEKATKIGKGMEKKRERGVDVPAVGKFRGGTLKLSRKDVHDIQGSGRPSGSGKKGRRR